MDLRAYAGQAVQIAFRFVADGLYTAPGWYVDDLSLETGVPTMDLLSNPEGFENGWGNWVVEGGVWNIGVPSSGPGSAHSGANLAATILNGDYPNSVDARLISPEFVVPVTMEQPYLRFWSWHSTQAAADYGQVQAQTNRLTMAREADGFASQNQHLIRRIRFLPPTRSRRIALQFVVTAI